MDICERCEDMGCNDCDNCSIADPCYGCGHKNNDCNGQCAGPLDLPLSFDVISGDSYYLGLCNYCDLVPCSSHPTAGAIMCEGRSCTDAYLKYVDSFNFGCNELCDFCKNYNSLNHKCLDCTDRLLFDPIEQEEN